MFSIQLDAKGNKPLYLLLRDALRAEILSGTIPSGARLPSSRVLARELHVSRNTVDEAFQYLIEDGLCYVKKGLGTFVCKHASAGKGQQTAALCWEQHITPSSARYTNYRETEGNTPRGKDVISFASLAPDHHVFAVDAFRKALADVLSREGGVLLNYGYVRGYEPLREYLKEYLISKGISFEGQELLIVSGFRQAVELVSRVLVKEGDVVYCEQPTYNGFIGGMKSRGAHLVGIDMDEHGMRVDLLEAAMEKQKPALVYCVPTYQNPTGKNMTLSRRRQLVAVCADKGVPLLEDGFSEELRYRGESYPSLKALDANGVVVYCGSFSKVLFPGLRVGWIVAPVGLSKYLVNEKFNEDIHTGLLSQAGLYEFCMSGGFEKHLRASRKLYKQRMNAMHASLQTHLGTCASWESCEGGFSCFVTFHPSIDTRALLPKAYKHGVAYVPGDVFYPDGQMGKNSLRLGFSRLDTDTIEVGIQRLAEVFVQT